jgi:hypothetical protein
MVQWIISYQWFCIVIDNNSEYMSRFNAPVLHCPLSLENKGTTQHPIPSPWAKAARFLARSASTLQHLPRAKPRFQEGSNL